MPLPLRISRPLEVLAVDEHHAKGSAFNMVFALWFRETQPGAFHEVGAALEKLAPSHPEGVGVCHVLVPGAIAPSAITRAEINKLMKRDEFLKHYSVTYEGTGFTAAAVRAIMSGSQMMTRTKTRLSVFTDFSEAAKWHAEQQRLIGRSETAEEIYAVVRRLRETYAAEISEKKLVR